MQDDAQLKSNMMKTGLISLVVVAVIVGAIIMFARSDVPKDEIAPTGSIQQIEPTAMIEKTGLIGLREKGTDTSYSSGDSVTLFIYADSHGDNITAYDAVIRYNPQLVTFDKVRSLVDGLDIIETVDEIDETANELIVTGIQSLDHNEPFTFENTALAEVTFTIEDAGDISFDMMYLPDSTLDSNLMNTQTQDILSEVLSVSITAE